MKIHFSKFSLLLPILVSISLGGGLTARERRADPVLDPTPAERQILSDYDAEVARSGQPVRSFAKIGNAKIPEDFAPWWIRGQNNTIGDAARSRSVTIEDLLVRALRHS